jgi:hypothetical protein
MFTPERLSKVVMLSSRSLRGVSCAGVMLGLLVLLAGCSGSSSSSSNPRCQSYCDGLCKTLEGCGTPVATDCAAQCATGTGTTDCSGERPADQLTCKEAQQSYACADYCATLCERAPSCGSSFNTLTCATGCATLLPPICNAASVAARTCDQLKPEIRRYQDAGTPAQPTSGEGSGSGDNVSSGDSSSPSSSASESGLCRSAEDCEAPLGCSTANNTCAACKNDADCAHRTNAYICSPEKACVRVQCESDDDCGSGGFCDVERHICGDCHSNADCGGFQHLCDPVTAKCSQCASNADCDEFGPRCDHELGVCNGCKETTDCAAYAGIGRPVCGAFGCVECASDSDCKDAARPGCDSDLDRCVECTKNVHCKDGKICDAVSNRCI